MRIRSLVHDVRCALRVSRISCELSDADLAAMLEEAAEEIGGRGRTRQIIECTVMRAHHVCEAMLAEREATARKPRQRQRKRSAGGLSRKPRKQELNPPLTSRATGNKSREPDLPKR